MTCNFSIESFPPVDLGDGTIECVSISLNRISKMVAINSHIEPKEWPDGKRPSGYSPEIRTSVSFSFDQLKWVGPRFDAFRAMAGIENGYDKIKNNE